MAENIFVTPTRVTSSQSIHTAACFLSRVLVGHDSTSDPTVAVYNEATDSKTASKRVLPRIVYDSDVDGLNGVVFEFMEFLSAGLYIEIVTGGNCEVIVGSRLATDASKYAFR